MKINNIAYYARIILFEVLTSVILVMADASIYLHHALNETSDTLPSYRHAGLECVSLSHLCESLGIEWQWDMYSERFKCSDGNYSISLIQNNNFYQVNDSTFQLAYPPVRFSGNLYLDARGTAAIFSRLKGRTVTWSKSDKSLTVTGESIEKKRSKTVETAIKLIVKPDGTEKSVVEKETVTPNNLSGTAIKEPKQRIKTIVIDPGHGGKDPGAIGPNGLKEKDVVLAVSLSLRDALEKNADLKIFMTRSTDVFIPLRQRTKFANEKNADLFISVHANSIAGNRKRKKMIKGYKVYFLSQAKNEEDKLAAMIENSVIELEEDIKKGDYLQNILIDMANVEFLTESQDLSIMIAESFGISLKKVNKLHTGVGQANFWVLNGAYMPSVLVETCFISNPNEVKLLKNKIFQKKLGVAICDAVIKFKEKYEAGL